MATVLITGASGGIGQALCNAFLQQGDDVLAVCGRHIVTSVLNKAVMYIGVSARLKLRF